MNYFSIILSSCLYVCVCIYMCIYIYIYIIYIAGPLIYRLIEFIKHKMAPHSSTLAWKIPWAEEPGRLPSMGSLRVRYD